MYEVFTKILNMSLTAGILALAVFGLRILLTKAPKKYICLLWALVALRLLCPVSISSPTSFYNVLPAETGSSGSVEYFRYSQTPEKPELQFERPVLPGESAEQMTAGMGVRKADLYLPAVLEVWLAGTVILLTYAVISCLQLRKQTAAAIRKDDGTYVCDDIDSPFILGIISPRIVLPSGLDPEVRRHVIAHEQAHVERHDHWWKPLGYVLLAVHWFNPVLWAAYIFLCRDIEAACDEKVVENMSQSEVAGYSESLLACAVQQRWITACPVAFGETNVKGRVKNVLNYKKPTFWIVLAAAAACIIAAVCFLTDPKKANAEPAGAEVSAAETVSDGTLEEMRAAAAHRVLQSVTEYPGSGLYQPQAGAYIGLDAKPEDMTQGADVQTKDYDAWKAALGDCFAENCFDAFYQDSARTALLDLACMDDLTMTVSSVEDQASDDNIQHCIVHLHVRCGEETIGDYPLDWRVIYSKDDRCKVTKVELLDYGTLVHDCQDHDCRKQEPTTEEHEAEHH